jgi:hypothetical protein
MARSAPNNGRKLNHERRLCLPAGFSLGNSHLCGLFARRSVSRDGHKRAWLPAKQGGKNLHELVEWFSVREWLLLTRPLTWKADWKRRSSVDASLFGCFPLQLFLFLKQAFSTSILIERNSLKNCYTMCFKQKINCFSYQILIGAYCIFIFQSSRQKHFFVFKCELH